MQAGVGENCVFRLIQKSPPKICIHLPRLFASMTVYWRRNTQCHHNFGGSRSLLITVTFQLMSTRLVVWKCVDDTHGIACWLCSS